MMEDKNTKNMNELSDDAVENVSGGKVNQTSRGMWEAKPDDWDGIDTTIVGRYETKKEAQGHAKKRGWSTKDTTRRS